MPPRRGRDREGAGPRVGRVVEVHQRDARAPAQGGRRAEQAGGGERRRRSRRRVVGAPGAGRRARRRALLERPRDEPRVRLLGEHRGGLHRIRDGRAYVAALARHVGGELQRGREEHEVAEPAQRRYCLGARGGRAREVARQHLQHAARARIRRRAPHVARGRR
jgi:hypothetical protein